MTEKQRRKRGIGQTKKGIFGKPPAPYEMSARYTDNKNGIFGKPGRPLRNRNKRSIADSV